MTNIYGGPGGTDHNKACAQGETFDDCTDERCEWDGEKHVVWSVADQESFSCPEPHDCTCEDIYYDRQADAADQAREDSRHG